MPNTGIRELCGVKEGLEERIDEGMLQWLEHVERMENDRNAKSVYVGESAGSPSVGRPWKRWIDTVKECLKKKKRGFDVRQDWRIVQDRNDWQGFLWGVAREMNPEIDDMLKLWVATAI